MTKLGYFSALLDPSLVFGAIAHKSLDHTRLDIGRVARKHRDHLELYGNVGIAESGVELRDALPRSTTSILELHLDIFSLDTMALERRWISRSLSILNSLKSVSGRATSSHCYRNLSTAPTPSTIDTGFILSLSELPNPATTDIAYQRILSWYLPAQVLHTVQPRLVKFGEEAVSDRVNELISNAERQPPYVKTRNVWGEKYAYDRLVTSQGWKELGAWGAKNG